MNYQLLALLEASKPNKDEDGFNTPESLDAEDAAKNNPDEDTGDQNTENQDTNNEEQQQDNNEQDDQNQEDNQEDKGDEPPTEEENPFGDEGGEGEGDDGPNPDGLPDPDDESSDMSDEESEEEQNVHINVLNLSKIDRTLAKKKCFADYQELRAKINAAKALIDNNEAAIEPDIRDASMDKLDRLYSMIFDYLRYKFSYLNYEETLQDYLLFSKSLNDIIVEINSSMDKDSGTTSRKPSKKKVPDIVVDENEEKDSKDEEVPDDEEKKAKSDEESV